jgi:RNA polymerase sigma factor (sigma-70 family)
VSDTSGFYNATSIDEAYRLYREDFLRFGKRFLENEEDITDIYQDSIMILFEHMQSGKLESIKCSVKTYLFSIGKYLMIDAFKKQKRTIFPGEEAIQFDAVHPDDIEKTIILTEQQQLIAQVLEKLDTNCQKILTFFYYRRYDLNTIAEQLGYKSANVVKSYKSRCMDRLRKHFITTSTD